MKVFVCWSGRRSQAFARILKEWLRGLLPRRLEVEMSVDIRKGTLWFDELDKALDGAQLGVVCLTAEGLGSPWIHYEAGILSRALREAGRTAGSERGTAPRVFPVLFGVESAQLSGPLGAYQSTSASSRDDMWRLAQTVSALAGGTTSRLRERFEARWSSFSTQLESVTPAPFHEIVPEIEDLFRGKAFEEPMEQDLVQDWLDRHDRIRSVHWKVREKLEAVKAACRPFISDLFNELAAEVEVYARNVSLLIGRPPDPVDGHGRVLFGQPGIARACEARRLRIMMLLAQLVDPRQAAVFEDACRFSMVGGTEQRKRLIHREAARLRALPANRKPTEAARIRWLDSDWDLDRILFFELLRDAPLKSFTLKHALRHIAVELEKVRFRPSDQRLSLMALYYSVEGLRRMLTALNRAAPRKELGAEANELLTELLAFIDRLGRTSNAPIRNAARDVAVALGLNTLGKAISGRSNDAVAPPQPAEPHLPPSKGKRPARNRPPGASRIAA